LLKEVCEGLKSELRQLKDDMHHELQQLKSATLAAKLESRLATLEPEPDDVKDDVQEVHEACQGFGQVFPMNDDNPLDGIISYLTQKHGGNVHAKEIVTITSRSVWNDRPKYRPKLVADLTTREWFRSKDEPNQWICWDFHERRVRLTQYTIKGPNLRSWVLEGSLDGEIWTEIDRQTDYVDFARAPMASFASASVAEFRFIRITQTDRRHDGHDFLSLRAVEFFGTLSE
jgi:hypothetical protein